MLRAFRHVVNVYISSLASGRFSQARQYATRLSLPPIEYNPGQNSAIKLRKYQEECLESVLSYLRNGHKRLGVSLATGSGKTVIFTQLIGRIQPLRSDASQTLILVHRRELVEQAALHCRNVYRSKTIEIEMGNAHASGTADITIASVWSITSGDRLLKFDPKKFKLVLVDEAHHIVAASFMKTLGHFGLLKADLSDSSPALVGVSATMSRFDGLRLSDAIDHIVYHKDYIDMIGQKWLSDVIFTTVKSTANVSKVKNALTGDFQLGDLSRAVNTQEINEITVRAWMERAAGRKSTLVFCVDLAHVSDLTAAFRRHAIDARFVTGDTHKRIRSDRLDSFKRGEFPVLLNCGVFTEGTDIPNIDCILLARPTKSRNLLVQMIGRGMRLHHDKNSCHVIDMVSSLEAGVVSTPTLFGLDPNTLVKEASVEEMKSSQERKELEESREKRAETKNPSLPKQGPGRTLTFTDYDSVYDLIDDTSGERHIRGISALAWVMVGPNRYVLSSQDGSYLSIEGDSSREEGAHTVTFTQKLSAEAMEASSTKSPYMRPRRIALSKTFSDAVHAADTFASSRMPWRVVHAGQAWRRYPASDAQLAFLNKFRRMEDQLAASTVTKGKANDMISKLKFGAKGWFSELEARKRREERVQGKVRQVEDLRQREQVKIGPVTQ